MWCRTGSLSDRVCVDASPFIAMTYIVWTAGLAMHSSVVLEVHTIVAHALCLQLVPPVLRIRSSSGVQLNQLEVGST